MTDVIIPAPMDDHAPLAIHETSTASAAAMAKADIEARCIMAMRNPRDIMKARETLIADCRRLRFAEVARYALPRGGKTISGPSIRFVESAIRAMRNVSVGSTVIYDDSQKRIVRITVTDLEANIPYTADIVVPKTMERKKLRDGQKPLAERVNSYGDKVYIVEAPDDEINVKQAALTSKAIRTLGLRVVPGDLVEEALDVASETIENGDAKDPSAARKRLADAFSAIGIKADQLATYLGHSIETVTPAEMSHLRGIYSGLKDGETTWADVMEAGMPSTNGNGKKPEAEPEDPAARKSAVEQFCALRVAKPKPLGEALRKCGFHEDTKAESMSLDAINGVLAAMQGGAK